MESSRATNTLFAFKETIDRNFTSSGETIVTTTNSVITSTATGGTATFGINDVSGNFQMGVRTGVTGSTRNVSILSTRSIQTSTTETYGTNMVSTAATTRTVPSWSVSLGNSTQSPTFYSTTQSGTAITRQTTLATSTRDTTTTLGTEVHYGLNNTIWQCRTSDFSAEIAWTAPNNFTLSNYAISAFELSNSVTRWTESRNNETIAASVAEKAQLGSGSPPPATASFGGITTELFYTTTSLQSFAETRDRDFVFPLATNTIERTRQATEAATSSLTYYAPATFTTLQGVNTDVGTAYIVPTIQTKEWFASKETYSTGNGTITWHEFTEVPATRFRTTQNAWAGTGNRIAPTFAPVLLIIESSTFANSGTVGAEGGGITMQLSTAAKAGVATTKAGAISVSVFGRVGSVISQSTGALVNLNLGKTFNQPNLTAHHQRQSAQTTVFPSTYPIQDTGENWDGALSINGKSASATFVPTDTNSAITTTTAEFSVLFDALTTQITQRNNIVGGGLVEGETTLAKWGNGLFVGPSGTLSSTASVVEQTTSSATSWFEPIVGLAPQSQINSQTVVSYTQLRNATLLPPIAYA
jgi:hypothetical protein